MSILLIRKDIRSSTSVFIVLCTYEGCCNTISVSTTITNIKEENDTKIYKLVEEYPRAYENSAGDRIARYGGVCGMKEKIGYWMVTI